MDKPLKSVTHSQCDASETVTFADTASRHHCSLAGTNLYIILLGNRGTWMWTTCLRLLNDSTVARNWSHVVQNLNYQTTERPCTITQIKCLGTGHITHVLLLEHTSTGKWASCDMFNAM